MCDHSIDTRSIQDSVATSWQLDANFNSRAIDSNEKPSIFENSRIPIPTYPSAGLDDVAIFGGG